MRRVYYSSTSRRLGRQARARMIDVGAGKVLQNELIAQAVRDKDKGIIKAVLDESKDSSSRYKRLSKVRYRTILEECGIFPSRAGNPKRQPAALSLLTCTCTQLEGLLQKELQDKGPEAAKRLAQIIATRPDAERLRKTLNAMIATHHAQINAEVRSAVNGRRRIKRLLCLQEL